jgi:hypothetical protein
MIITFDNDVWFNFEDLLRKINEDFYRIHKLVTAI